MLTNNLLLVKNLYVYYPIKQFFNQRVEYDKTILKNINFSIDKGSTLGIVGESGSGKTTLAKAILRLVGHAKGDIFYNNQNIMSFNKKEMILMRRKLQIILQDSYTSLNPVKNIESILQEPIHIHGVIKKTSEIKKRINKLLELVCISKTILTKYPYELSGGQRQRIAIVRSLVLNPEFIICDESVASLDISVQIQILNLLKNLQKEFNLTFLFISHDLNIVRYMSNKIAIIKDGKIIEQNYTKQIFQNPKQDYTKRLISAHLY